MEISPQAVAAASFRTTKRGYDPEEVRAFLSEVSRGLESAQQHATAMEARARAAVQRLQEMAQAPAAPEPTVPADDAETISRTLLLAQRTADATVAEARAEADALLASARAEAATLVAEARRQADSQLAEARSEARRAMEAERLKIENEVQSLVARREFLLADVEHLEEFAASQRRRLQDTAELLREVAERSPGGLGEMRRPLLSAAGEPPATAATATEEPGSGMAAEALAAGTPTVVTAATDAPTVEIPVAWPTGDNGEVDAGELATSWEPATPVWGGPTEVASVDNGVDEALGTSATGEFVDSAPTPPQQSSLLDFDAITEQIPALRRQEPDDELRLRDDV